MIILVGAVVALVTVPLAGGSLRSIDRRRLRGGGWMAAAIVIQQVLPVIRDGWAPRTLYVASFGLAGVFVAMNYTTRGMRWLGVGGALNLIAVVANGGVMPASPAAWQASGAPRLSSRWFSNARPLAHAVLRWLGDVIAFPSWVPGAAPFSIGDGVIVGGLVVLVHHLAGAPWACSEGNPPLRVRSSGPVTSTTNSVESNT